MELSSTPRLPVRAAHPRPIAIRPDSITLRTFPGPSSSDKSASTFPPTTIHQSRQLRAAGGVDDCCAGGNGCAARGAHMDDALALDEHHAARDRRVAGAVDDAAAGNAVIRAASGIDRIEADVDQRLAADHNGPGVHVEHDARMRRLRFRHQLAEHVVVVADHLVLGDRIAAAHRRLEEAAAIGAYLREPADENRLVARRRDGLVDHPESARDIAHPVWGIADDFGRECRTLAAGLDDQARNAKFRRRHVAGRGELAGEQRKDRARFQEPARRRRPSLFTERCASARSSSANFSLAGEGVLPRRR